MADFADSSSDKQVHEGYLSDAENATEMARLMIQDHLLTQAMRELVPEAIDLSQVHRVLDIGCGPGGWLFDLVAQYPHIQGVGIDINHLMIDYATGQATSQDLSHVQFRVMDATQPLQFADNTFDMVNGRILMGFLTTEQWPFLLQECY
jgi:ubiquinone/menaquinone biosynthesis C-methylase UbiE